MTEGRDDPRGPAAPVPGIALPDDEPTLETETSVADDDPTLETETRAAAGESTPAGAVPRATGWAARLEHLTAAKHERRRNVTRLWLAGVPVVVLVALAAVLLAVYGGQGAGGAAVSTSTTAERHQVEGSGLLLVTEDGVLSWVVALQPLDQGGVVLAVPGITLLESHGVFKTLADMYQTDDRQVVASALAKALDMSVGPAAEVEWPALQAAVTAAHIEGFPSEAMGVGQGEAESVAGAVRTLVSVYVADGDSDLWDDMNLGGEASEFLLAVGLDAASMGAKEWLVGPVTGTVVDGEGYYYLEPDLEAAKSLLAVAVQTVTVSVEVKDGAGIEGAARRAGDLLEAGGLALAPMSYADGYPGIEKTQVVSAAAAAEKARQVQSLLGVGEMVQDDALGADRITVILGKDFSGPASAQGTE